MQSEECEEQKNIKWERKKAKRNTKYHRICITWYLFHSHSLHFNEFYAAHLCTVNFSVLCMNMEWGERERVSKQKQEISAWKNVIILILRIFTSGKNSQRSCILYDRRWRRYGVDNRFSRVHERENECEREKETLSWQREAHGVSGWTLVEYFQF